MSYYKHGNLYPIIANHVYRQLPEPTSYDDTKIETLRHLYIEEDMSVKEICNHYGVEYTSYLQKLFFIVFGAKGKGWGGARKNAGKRKNKTNSNN